MSKEASKAAHYIEQLDEERCKGNWQAVPELVRKIKKHAPNRSCLCLAAKSEGEVAIYDYSRQAASGAALNDLIKPLLEAIEAETTHKEDALQAQVCVSWVHWTLHEPGLASSRLPREFVQRIGRKDGGVEEASSWTKICALKAIFIKGASLYKTLGPVEALEVFGFALPLLSVMDISGSGTEQRLWIERLLTTSCQISNALAIDGNSTISDATAISFFRAWARLWEARPGQTFKTDGIGPGSEISRRDIWKAYYELLTRALSHGNTYHRNETYPSSGYLSSARGQQRTEIRRVQVSYERLLLRETSFPRATETTLEVEHWTDLVMQNWMILCGDSWYDEELGEGGKEAASREILEILYRAAAKTFHSTAILRYLFAVHASLSEFELAFKALDTYLDIALRGKSRVEKSGEPESALDSDDRVIETAASGIRLLCQHGQRIYAERACEIAALVESWLQKCEDTRSARSSVSDEADSAEPHGVWENISPKAIVKGHQAVATAQAHWARLTYDTSGRTENQSKAIAHYKRALNPELDQLDNTELLFEFCILLAETRKLSAAIEVAKRALAASSRPTISDAPNSMAFSRERRLLPMWHLLSLLLSARQEFSTASKACNAAFEQFQSPNNLFGTPGRTSNVSAYSSEEYLHELRNKGAIASMPTYEKATILQLKMTQIALVEISESPEHAVNISEELLALFARLFGNFEHKDTTTVSVPATPVPPKSSAGTLRSVSGSIFGRPRSMRRAPFKSDLNSLIDEEGPSNRPKTAASQATAVTGTTNAPTIQVTNEHGDPPSPKSHRHHPHIHLRRPSSSHGNKLQKSNSTVRSQKSLNSFRKHKATKSDPPPPVEQERVWSPAPQIPAFDRNNFQDRSESQASEQPPLKDYSPSPSQVGLAVSPEIPSPAPSPQPSYQHLRSAAETLAAANPASKRNTGRSKLPQSQVLPVNGAVRPLSYDPPRPRFSAAEDHHQKTALLIKTWLLIATLYRRTELFGDAKGAIEEAQKLVEELEQVPMQDQNWSKLLDTPGWGCAKSISELWGDVLTESGNLALAQSQPYDALAHFEAAVSKCTDHPSGTVGLCNLLLDISSGSLPAKSTTPIMKDHFIPPGDSGVLIPTADPILSHIFTQQHKTTSSLSTSQSPPQRTQAQPTPLGIPDPSSSMPFSSLSISTTSPPATTANGPLHPSTANDNNEDRDHLPEKKPSRSSPEALDRLAARDRAYGLLSTLTKLGSGWDSSEAWFALARAYEESGQVERAKEALWWCVELEDGRPIRSWREAGGINCIL